MLVCEVREGRLSLLDEVDAARAVFQGLKAFMLSEVCFLSPSEL